MRVLPVLSAGLVLVTVLGEQAQATDGQALQIIVSKDQQQVTVYDGLDIVAQSNVSTGKPGHSTPSGIFSILEKQKYHRSNIYSNAPMPWMQRITWSGVALHESNHVPPHPASHGCVRLPAAFAKELFKMTERGAHVIISDEPVSPTRLSGPALFKPRTVLPEPSLTDAPLRASIGSKPGETIEVAMNDAGPTSGAGDEAVAEREPIYVMITRSTEQNRNADVQTRLNALGFDTGEVDGVVGRRTRAAIRQFRRAWLLSAKNDLDDEFFKYLDLSDHKGLPPNGQLMIRSNFKEIYRAGIRIDQPEIALGTHFMEALHISPDSGDVDWYGVSLNNHLSDREAERLGITQPAATAAFNEGVRALERIEMSPETRKEVETRLADGSSITITDTGYQRETGLGTNFVTLTRKAPAL